MKDSVVTTHFGPDHAATYDDRGKTFAPVRNALDFLSQLVLLELPSEARVLCVGAGTGADLLHLALKFPHWRFTAVEPSAAMLDVCRNKAKDAGIAGRCEFHEGFLDSLPSTAPFDAGTSVLVSQFLTDPEQRTDFFRQIATRLRPGAIHINVDLASPFDPITFENVFNIWWRANSGTSIGAPKASDSGWGKSVSVSAPKEIEAMIGSAGFTDPILFYQALFIHAWYAKRGT